MNNNFTDINAVLVNANFNFNIAKKTSQLTVNQADEITISKVCDHHFELIITRRLTLLPAEQTLAEASFNVRINTESAETESSITEKIKGGLSALGTVFSRISLVISQITSQGPYGPIITAPLYDKNKVIIRTAK